MPGNFGGDPGRNNAKRERKKKLTVAFHFLRGDQAGWRCDTCRKNGLEKKRRCGWLDKGQRGPEVVVWARAGAVARECPKTLVTGESAAWVERFVAWRLGGGHITEKMAAREVEAFQLLSIESEREKRDE